MRTPLTAVTSGIAVVLVFAIGCGDQTADDQIRDASGSGLPADGAIPTGGTGGGGGAALGSGGTGGAAPTDAASAVDAAADAPADAAIDPVPPPDAADDVIADAGTDATSVDAPPPFDPGPGCVAPGSETPLAAAAEGLPAAGLVLWLRGDRGIYKTATQNVCAWADQSGNHQIFAKTGARPVWAATGLGGQAAVHFTAGGQGLLTGGVFGIGPASPRTFIAVTALVTTNRRFHPIFQGQGGTPGTYFGLDANTFNTAGSREGVYATNSAYDTALATSTAPRVHVFTLLNITPGTPILSGVDYRVNGATQTLTRTPGGLGTAGTFQDFSRADGASIGEGGGDGFVAEVLVYDRALSVDERAAVEAALRTRYGIQ